MEAERRSSEDFSAVAGSDGSEKYRGCWLALFLIVTSWT